MAKASSSKKDGIVTKSVGILSKSKRTSIGKSKLTKPRNKDKKRSWKAYRGQGSP